MRFKHVRHQHMTISIPRTEMEELKRLSDMDDEDIQDEEMGGTGDTTLDPIAAWAAKLKGQCHSFTIRFKDMMTELPKKTNDELKITSLTFKAFKDALKNQFNVPIVNRWWFEWTSTVGDGEERSYKVNNNARLREMVRVTHDLSKKAHDPRSNLNMLVYKRGKLKHLKHLKKKR